jgi:hypothetical protein
LSRTGFSPEIFSPEIFSPEIFSPEIFSPEIFSPEIFSPEIEIAFLPEMDYSKNQGLHVIRLFTDQTITTLYS